MGRQKLIFYPNPKNSQQSRPDTEDSGKGAKSSLLPKMKNTRNQCEQSQFHLWFQGKKNKNNSKNESEVTLYL